MKTKTFEGQRFTIDRPEGTVKTWPGGKSFTYPCDYGFFPGIDGEDGEGLDAFVGDDPQGHFESFQKLRKDDAGRTVLDETKFLVGVDDAAREAIYALYRDEVHARRTYRGMAELVDAAGTFKKGVKERYRTKDPFTEGLSSAWDRYMKPAEKSASARYAFRVHPFMTKRAGAADRARLDALRTFKLGGLKAADIAKVLKGDVLAVEPPSQDPDRLDAAFRSIDATTSPSQEVTTGAEPNGTAGRSL